MKPTPRWTYALGIMAALVAICGAIAAVQFDQMPNLSEGEAISLRGGLKAVAGIDIRRLKESLPMRLQSSPEVMVFLSDQVTCPYCVALPTSSNGTGVPAVFVTECTPPSDRPAENVTTVRPGGLAGLPPEIAAAEPVSLLIDFNSGAVTVAPGNVPTWTDCLEELHRYEPYSMEKP